MRRRLTIVLTGVFVAASAGAFGWPVGAAPGDYRQPVIFESRTGDVDVLVVPPNHGQLLNDNGLLGGRGLGELTPANSYLPAIEQSVQSFSTAVAQFGPDWLRKGLRINVYVLGRDTPPLGALLEPEVVIATDEDKLDVVGVAITGLDPCIVDNSKLAFGTSFTFEDMYNINAQEFGHCLGLDHVEPARDPVLRHDPLNGVYPHRPGTAGTHLHCVSNLNVRGLEQVFKRTLRQEGGGETVTMAPSEYRQIAC